MSWEYVLADPDNPDAGGSYQFISDFIEEPYVPDQQITDFITRSTSPPADDTAAWEGMGSWSPVSSDANSSPWQELTAKEDTDLYGVRVFKDASDPTNIKYLSISPSGEYFLNGEKVWSPSGASSNWGTLISKLGNFATSPQGIATILGSAFQLGRLNKSTTGGYKGSIPNLTAVREQVKMPEYTPYSGKAVMGGKFFTDTQYTPTANTEALEAAKTAATTIAEKYAATNPQAPNAATAPNPNVTGPVLTKEKTTATGILKDFLKESNSGYYDERAGRILAEAPAKEKPNVTTPIDPEYSLVDPIVSPNRPGEVEEEMRSYTDALATIPAAQGGIMQLAKGRYLRGGTDGMSDKIPSSIDGVQPAALSHGEFVIPADVVSHLGNGNSDAGADQLYRMMDRVRKDRTGTVKQGKKIKPEKYFPGGVAYSKGGIASFTAGGETSLSRAAGANPLGASQETALSPYVGDYATNMLGRAQALAGQGYQAYGGPLSAGYSPLQQQAFTAAGNINPQATFGTANLQQYMNPYTQLSLQPQLDELRRQSQISQQGTQGQFTRAGALGGARDVLARSENLRNLQTAQAGVIGRGFESAFDRAMGQYNIGRQQQLADVGALAGLGAQERAIEQQGIDQLRGEFEKQRQFPYEQLKFGQSMLSGLPIGSTSVTPNTSPISDLALTTEQVTKLSQWLKDNVFNTSPG